MDIIDKIISNVGKTTKAVVQKSNDVVEITKTKVAISGAEDKIRVILGEIGALVYDAYKGGDGNTQEVEEKCKQIEEIKKELDEKRNQYAKLRNMKRCPECENENDSAAVFCNKCGAKLPECETCIVDDMPQTESAPDEVIDAQQEAENE